MNSRPGNAVPRLCGPRPTPVDPLRGVESRDLEDDLGTHAQGEGQD